MVADTVSNVCQTLDPVLATISSERTVVSHLGKLPPTQEKSDVVRVGLVEFPDYLHLLTESTNLKRLHTLLYCIDGQAENIGTTAPQSNSDLEGVEVQKEQLIWVKICTTIISEVLYQQEVLLKTKVPEDYEDYASTTEAYFNLADVAGGYASDLAITVQGLGVIAQYERSGSDKSYTPSKLGRTNTWEVTGITIKEKKIQVFLDEWSEYMQQLSNGQYGDQVRQLKVEPIQPQQ
ncbi:MAG: hypothetical protein GDA56_25280 [Hormoscilla sp. GM7CHS1pb]|nr:hypothetical protein [Hormoscilla sp. GM7CHS1pb]